MDHSRLMIDEEINAEDGKTTLLARGMAAPKTPSKEEIARHNLTHLPYRNWCPHCLASRRPNSAHRSSKTSSERSIPVFVCDYFFVRKPDEDLLTGLAGKLYPSHSFFASVCDVKGPEDSVTDRLAEFLKDSGVTKLVYKSDQEPAIRAMLEKALNSIGRTGDPRSNDEIIQLVPESSAVGESPSNGKAERAVQSIEDMTRTYLSALEGRIRAKIPTQHPVMRWLVEHAASMLNRFSTNPSGQSPYAYLHGRNPNERHIEFGEKVFYHVPRRARSKLCMKWRLGTYLGMAPSSNEVYVATIDGDVTKTRSVARVVEGSRWDSKAIEKVHGVPGKLIAMPVAHSEQVHLEEHIEPHLDADAADRELVDVEGEERKERAESEARITEKDLRKYGYHPGCPKCDESQGGKAGRKFKSHSPACRMRMYEAWRDDKSWKYKYVSHLFEDKAPDVVVGAEPIDLQRDSAAASIQIPMPEHPPREDDLRRTDEPDHSGQCLHSYVHCTSHKQYLINHLMRL